MTLLETFTDTATRFLPMLVVLALTLFSLVLINRLLKRQWQDRSNTQFRFQLIMLLLTFIGALAVIISLPLSDTLRGQLLSLIGILLSAAIALSSTTFIGNILAGIMLRIIKNARPGDFITVNDITGRVTEMGLLHTEVQTEDRDLVTLPNLYLATHPMKVVRATGTIVSAEVSLGYDVSRNRVDKLLRQAGEKAGLEDTFVQVRELGDFSVLYRVAGLLREVTGLLSARAHLRAAMLDTLHDAGVEIVSPTFMNSRVLSPDEMVVPARSPTLQPVASIAVENVAFDKAETAATIENLRLEIEQLDDQLAELDPSQPNSKSLRAALKDRKERLLAQREAAKERGKAVK